ncbi:agmatine deiminase family protein [Magnetovibrio sp. PR-2]|uniref:agmatine deiminase family protein n=1 Tax=Magnetovibrio sp. PR-2 TaxID=3120356 RepID=UPI002FCE12D1
MKTLAWLPLILCMMGFGVHAADKHLIVIAAPSLLDTHDDPDYAEVFDDIVEFDIAYANAVYGHDDVRVVVDEETVQFYKGRVPDEVLVIDYMPHIWARDYTTINPDIPVQFRYTAHSFEGDQSEADFIQTEFNRFTKAYGLNFPKTKYILDGGNIVDNSAGRVITTTRFLKDNGLTKSQGIAVLKDLLNATQVAVLPPDHDWLAHSDGMVMFVEENTLFVNRYDEPFRTEVLDELHRAFPGIKIVEIEADWDDSEPGSACGINVNATVTPNYIYMPHFDNRLSDVALKTIQRHTTKQVIAVPSNTVCKLGGSVRCLTWQTTQSPHIF